MRFKSRTCKGLAASSIFGQARADLRSRWNRLAPVWLALVILGAVGTPALRAGEPEVTSFATLARQYQSATRPLLEQFCVKCHSTDEREGELDLERFETLADVRRDVPVWQKVVEMLDHREMPPKSSKQPTAPQRDQLRGWVDQYLRAEALAHAGDPGPVVLRRLSNAQYTYTLRDLTGLESLDPAREFPVDGAAGEGFTNTGGALVMSPALLAKYLASAKQVAAHAVLLPDGFRFSPGVTRRDWTNEILARIQAFYRQFSDDRGSDTVNLQGIVFNTNDGGRLPLEKYLEATLAERETLIRGSRTIADVARDRKLNAKYLGILWRSLTSSEPSLLLDEVRAQWRTARPDQAAALVARIAVWQKELWRFRTVGHIGKVGGPRQWLEPVDPLTSRADIRFKIPATSDGQDIMISLVASDAGDGHADDFVVWQQPRLVAPGRPDLLLRDVRAVTRELTRRREQVFAQSARYLGAAGEFAAASGQPDLPAIARKHQIEPDALAAWLDYLGIGSGDSVRLKDYLPRPITNGTYAFIKGWGFPDLPELLANSSDQAVRVPGNMKPHGVAVHPTPKLRVAVGWRSPTTATFRLTGAVKHAHPECGNGVTWSLELRRGQTRHRLASGVAQGGNEIKLGPIENLAIHAGDLVSLLIGPRDGNHSCDLTAIDLTLAQTGNDAHTWDLARDVSGDVQSGNPHRDRFGNDAVWHFYAEPDKGGPAAPLIPEGSLVAKWLAAHDPAERRELAQKIQKLLSSGPPVDKNSPDAALYRQVAPLGGPLFGALLQAAAGKAAKSASGAASAGHSPNPPGTDFGLEASLFGKHPGGRASQIGDASLCVQAPSVITVRLPADLAAGCELVATGMLDQASGADGSAQLQVVPGRPDVPLGVRPDRPVLVRDGTAARKRIETAFEDFRSLFPAAICYTKIVPVDEVITLMLFYREDDHLVRLMLDQSQKAYLDRLWDELRYVSQDALTLVDAFAQLLEYASQDADPSVFAPLKKPINDRAAAFRQRLKDTEPIQVDALLDFAARAYRRPLDSSESQALKSLYQTLRSEGLDHEQSFRLTMARILVSSPFLYRIETPGSGSGQGPVSDFELASRLSYFLWSSQPDDELRRIAAAGKLHETDVLLAQTRRMVRDDRIRRLATEFGCQWLQIYDFDQHDEKSPRTFPTFGKLRGLMYEESIRFLTDLFQSNGRVAEVLDADQTFLNQELAEHYGIPGVTGPEWRRVSGVRKYERGGILRQATTLAKQSGASRTSPILRGNWVSEVLLGERLPRPPKGVPPLPDDEAAIKDLTVRQLVEKHTTDVKCAVCHRRIDPFGFALEQYDAIGRWREKDLGGRPIDTRTRTPDGRAIAGAAGLERYLLEDRRDAFIRQFCRKLLGYALGRAVQLSDEPLLAEMRAELESHDGRILAAVLAIVRSRQFREIRGRSS